MRDVYHQPVSLLQVIFLYQAVQSALGDNDQGALLFVVPAVCAPHGGLSVYGLLSYGSVSAASLLSSCGLFFRSFFTAFVFGSPLSVRPGCILAGDINGCCALFHNSVDELGIAWIAGCITSCHQVSAGVIFFL